MHCRSDGGLVYICLADNPPEFQRLGGFMNDYVGVSELAGKRQGRLHLDHYRTGQLEAGDRKQPRMLSLRRQPPSLCRTYSDNPLMTVMEGPNAASPEILAHWDRCDKAGIPARFVNDPGMQWRFRACRC